MLIFIKKSLDIKIKKYVDYIYILL